MSDSDDTDLEEAQRMILDQGAVAIKRAANDLGLSLGDLTEIMQNATIRSSPDCLTVDGLSDVAHLSPARKAHLEQCDFCESVIAAMNEPPIAERRAEFIADVRDTQAPAAAALADQTWLVVEEETVFRNVLRDILEGAGAKVESAASIPEAMETAKRIQPDGVVDDLFLEKGAALLTKLDDVVKQPFGSISFCRDAKQRAESKRAGYDACLYKPFSALQLVETAYEVRKKVKAEQDRPRNTER